MPKEISPCQRSPVHDARETEAFCAKHAAASACFRRCGRWPRVSHAAAVVAACARHAREKEQSTPLPPTRGLSASFHRGRDDLLERRGCRSRCEHGRTIHQSDPGVRGADEHALLWEPVRHFVEFHRWRAPSRIAPWSSRLASCCTASTGLRARPNGFIFRIRNQFRTLSGPFHDFRKGLSQALCVAIRKKSRATDRRRFHACL